MKTIITWIFLTVYLIDTSSLTAQNPANIDQTPWPVLSTCTSTCTGNLGENIFPDGDFGSGIINILPNDPGIAPGYIYTTNPPPGDGFYCITNNTTTWGSYAATDWINILDNDPSANGYMMVVNASNQPGLFYQKTVNVCESTLYEFSMDVISLLESHLAGLIQPNISFIINGTVVCETGNIPANEQWRTVRFSFTTLPGQSSVQLALRNNAPGGAGNDLAIDNISFRACGPQINLPGIVDYCNDEPIVLDASLQNSPYFSIVYQWQTFLNGTWVDVPNAGTASLNVPSPIDGSSFRLVVANSTGNLPLLNCRAVSNPVQLELLPTVTENRTYSLCEGNSMLLGGILFNASNPAGTVSLPNSTGCDTVVQVQLNFAPPPPLTQITQFSCRSMEVGTRNFIYPLPSGCDSMVRVTTLYDASLISQTAVSEGVCELGLVGLDTLWLTGWQGCDSIVMVDRVLDLNLIPSLAWSASSTACPGVDDGAILILPPNGGNPPYQYALGNGVFQLDAQFSNLAEGTYTVVIQDAEGCTASDIIEVGSEPAPTVWLSPDTMILWGNPVQLQATVSAPTGVASVVWSPAWSLDCLDCLDPTATPTTSTAYQVTTVSPEGCTATATQRIEVVRDKIPVYLPNVFELGAPYPNDAFNVFADTRIQVVQLLQVYDRWGQLVFENSHFAPDAPGQGWDGRFRGKPLEAGVFAFYCEVVMPDGGVVALFGNVTLLR